MREREREEGEQKRGERREKRRETKEGKRLFIHMSNVHIVEVFVEHKRNN